MYSGNSVSRSKLFASVSAHERNRQMLSISEPCHGIDRMFSARKVASVRGGRVRQRGIILDMKAPSRKFPRFAHHHTSRQYRLLFVHSLFRKKWHRLNSSLHRFPSVFFPRLKKKAQVRSSPESPTFTADRLREKIISSPTASSQSEPEPSPREPRVHHRPAQSKLVSLSSSLGASVTPPLFSPIPPYFISLAFPDAWKQIWLLHQAHIQSVRDRLSNLIAALPITVVPTLSRSPGLPLITLVPRNRRVEGSTPVASKPKIRKNPHLEGNYRPVSDEIIEEVECEVIGEIPQDLRGAFFRNGPNPQFVDPTQKYHLFDGDGMVHAVRFSDTKVTYSRRWVRTNGWEEEHAAGRQLYGGMSHIFPPIATLAIGFLQSMGISRDHLPRDLPRWMIMKNVANTGLCHVGPNLLALHEGCFPYALDPKDLTTKGVERFGGKLECSFTAHPKRDPQSGHLMFFGYDLLRQPHLNYGVINPEGDVVHSTRFSLPCPGMMHDFAITEHHTLFLDFPLRFHLDSIIKSGGKGKLFVFEPNEPSRIGVVPRFGTEKDIMWFRVKPGFVIHTMNAYEEENEGGEGTSIVLQAFRLDAFSALSLADIPTCLQSGEVSRLHEYRINLATGESTERSLNQVCSDFPTLNPNYLGRKNLYGYSAHFYSQPGPGNQIPLFDGLIKHDLDNTSTKVHRFGPGRFGGEPMFIPRTQKSDSEDLGVDDDQSSKSAKRYSRINRVTNGRVGGEMDPNLSWSYKQMKEFLGRLYNRACVQKKAEESVDVGEDYGWLLVHVWDDDEGQSEVLVIDAQNVDAPPIARVVMPSRVPFGFHGVFIPMDKGSNL